MKKRRVRPRFKSESEERKFWETHDSAPYVDWRRPSACAFQT